MNEKKDEKKDDKKKSLELVVIEHYPQARITYQVARQLAPYLPATSFEQISEQLREIVIDDHRLPTKIFASHIDKEQFPIRSIEDLVAKLTTGVRQAIDLAHSRSFQIKSSAVVDIVAKSREGAPGRRLGVPVGYLSESAAGPGRARYKGGK